MASTRVVIDNAARDKVINDSPGLPGQLLGITLEITAKCNALGAGFRTGKYHRDHKSPAVGGTAPVYTGDVKRGKKGPIGIVHPKNYAAMKDNYKHNTMLKSI